ncbi:antibiotic biosynthesis monooxygenase [Pseudomonas monteilii]|uniref:antibiotic biosynthesis monooxygenase n=1 Tax=Pseudomonas monteilii TaxID=76759 RepID=UPI003F6DA703
MNKFFDLKWRANANFKSGAIAMSLTSASAIEVRFDKRPDDDVLLAIDALVNVLRTEPGCMSYSTIALNKYFSSMIISGFWTNEKDMIDHFSNSSFAALIACLTSSCRSICFRSLFMDSEIRSQHAEP